MHDASLTARHLPRLIRIFQTEPPLCPQEAVIAKINNVPFLLAPEQTREKITVPNFGACTEY